MIYEKYELVSAKFTPTNAIVYHDDARVHIGKTFRWMHFTTEQLETRDGTIRIDYFTPHDKGYETVPAVARYELSDIKRIERP